MSALVMISSVLGAAAAPRSPLEGAWSFETGLYNAGCRLKGSMTVEEKRADGAHLCRIKVRETCPAVIVRGRQVAPALQDWADESCLLSARNGRVTIRSQIIHSSEPTYLPDDFDVQPAGAARMEGRFASGRFSSSAVFTREPAALS